MVRLCSIVCTILLHSLYSVDVQADISLPSFGDRIYVSKGSDVTLAWTYDFPGKTIVATQWHFRNDVISKEVLAHIVGSTVTIANSSLPNISVIQPATLVLKNVSLDYNGTYTLEVTVLGVFPGPSDILVIVVVRPVANINCTSPVNITEGENVSCICFGVDGNPPPTAYWLKDNNPIPMPKGYLSAPLDIRNVSKNDNGTYTCRVQSRNLTDEQRVDITVFDKPVANINCPTSVSIKEGKDFNCTCSGNDGSPPPSVMWLKDNKKLTTVDNILKLRNISKLNNGTYVCRVQSGNLWEEEQVDVTVLYKPRNISFSSKKENNTVTSGDTVEITCNADASPEASYSISFNGSQQLTDDVNGVYNINSVNDNHAGKYTCVAKNSLGSVSSHFVLTVKVRSSVIPTRTVYPSASTSTAPPDTRTTGAPTSKKDKNIAPIVGGAIGGVVFLIICIVLIWYCCCKRSASGSCKGGNGGEEDIVVNPANPSYAAMGDSMDRGNPYESVDQAKIDQARAADEAGPSNESPPDAANSLPPVYAVVDKSKKTPKPPPEKQPDSLTYASLDPVVLQPDSSKMRDRTREETNYASIDLEKLKKDQE